MTAPGDHVTTYAYETAGTLQQRHALLSVEYPDATHNYFTYDSHGRLIETHRDGGAEAVTYSYDSAGTVTVEDATSRQVILYFGLGGKLVRMRDGEGNAIGLGYDGNYQLTQMTGPGGEGYAYSYDADGNIIGVEDPVRQTTAFEYELSFNNLASVTDARGNGMQYKYDSSGNLLSITYEDGTSESFTYDASGNVLTWTNRRGDTITYTYNAAGQVTSKDYSDTPALTDYTYEYDDAGNLVSATDPMSTTNMTYNPDTDWLTRIDYPGDNFFVFEYNDAGQRTKRTDQDGNVVNYIYNSPGRLDLMTNTTDCLIVDYDYDAAGRLSQKTLGNGVYTTYEYDDSGRLLHLVNYAPTDAAISRFDYPYDASGRRTSMTTLGGTSGYEYDPLGQLISVTHPDGHVVEYVYDAVGNRIEVIDDGVVAAYTTNEMNQYTDVGGVTYTYDDDGNMIGKTEDGVTTTYTYNIENRLVVVTTPTDTWTYTYDASGNRIASTHNGVTTNYVIDPVGLGDVVAEFDSSGTLIARYDHGFGLLSRTDSGGTSAYYTFNAIGSTSEMTAADGSVLNSYVYDPFGIVLTQSETVANAFQYAGEYGVTSEDTALYVMRARYYAAEVGRFLSPDPIGLAGGVNLYTYVSNGPLTKIDPTGLYEWDAIKHYSPYVAAEIKREAQFYCDWLRKGMEKGIDLIVDLALAFLSRGRSVTVDIRDIDWSDPENWGSYEIIPEVPLSDIINIPTDPLTTDDTTAARSVDPNDKIAPAGYGGANFISEDDDLLAYTIRFENQPDATAPAHIIRITDTLDDDLDMSTFELTEIAFADQGIIVPDGLNHYETDLDIVIDNEFVSGAEIRCEIDISLDMDTRELTFEMIGLDPATGWLPEDIMRGVLYPNDDTGRGDGRISYLVRHVDDLPSGTEITNKARIYFDWNDPIDTPLVLNTIDAGSPESHVTDLIVNGTSVLVSWSGQDDAGGSGVASYDIYVSDNGGSFELWLDHTALTEDTFVGEVGHTYALYSIARDGVGHVEEAPEGPDATTVIAGPTNPIITITTPVPYGIYTVGMTLNFSATDSESSVDTVVGNLTNASGVSQIVDSGFAPAVGVYTLVVTATDNAGNTKVSDPVFFVVYDPDGGHATGGGWFYPDDESTRPGGKANFGFTARYKNDVSTGKLSFQYKDADIHLKSTSIDWLTISSVSAQFQGTGTINGDGLYTFRVQAKDNGEPGAGTDHFDIKIWNGTDTEADPYHKAKNTISGGNIQVHTK